MHWFVGGATYGGQLGEGELRGVDVLLVVGRCDVVFVFVVLVFVHEPLHAVVRWLCVTKSAQEVEVVVVDALNLALSGEVVQTAVEVGRRFRSVFPLITLKIDTQYF